VTQGTQKNTNLFGVDAEKVVDFGLITCETYMDLLGSQVSARPSETEEGEHDSTMNKSAAVSRGARRGGIDVGGGDVVSH
jgi:hypothetical protein